MHYFYRIKKFKFFPMYPLGRCDIRSKKIQYLVLRGYGLKLLLASVSEYQCCWLMSWNKLVKKFQLAQYILFIGATLKDYSELLLFIVMQEIYRVDICATSTTVVVIEVLPRYHNSIAMIHFFETAHYFSTLFYQKAQKWRTDLSDECKWNIYINLINFL